jgi:hypothetical protein
VAALDVLDIGNVGEIALSSAVESISFGGRCASAASDVHDHAAERHSVLIDAADPKACRSVERCGAKRVP